MSRPDIGAGRTAPLGIHRSTVWSTRVDLVVTDPHRVVAAADQLRDILARVDAVASRFRTDSEVNTLHRSARSGTPVPVSADLLEAVTIALRAARLTGGVVDPTVGRAMCRLGFDRDFASVRGGVAGHLPEPHPVPGWRSVDVDAEHSTVTLDPGVVLDLGATAKAWAVDRAASSIAARLHCGVLVSIGGDLAVGGPVPGGGFAVGIADVCGDPDAPQTVGLESGGLATSGVGQRHWSLGGTPVHHLIDPATGRPAVSPWRTVSVAAGSCVDANTASTAAVIMGERAVGWLEDRGLPSRLVRLDGTTVLVAGWPEETPRSVRSTPQASLAR